MADPKDEKTVSELDKLLEEKHQCEFPGCTFEANALKCRDDHGEEKMVMVQVTLFKVTTKVDENGKKVEEREMVEAVAGKGVRPVVLHWTHAGRKLKEFNELKSEGLPFVYETATLEEAILYQFDKTAREQSFAEVVEYFQKLDEDYGKKPPDRKMAEPAPKSNENKGGNPIELCGVPVGSAHGRVTRYFINRKNEVVGLCGRCVAAYFKAETERLKICGNRDKAEEIAASKREWAEKRRADDEAAEKDKARLRAKFGEYLDRGWNVMKAEGDKLRPATSKKPKRADGDPKMSGGKKSQRRQDSFKDEADTSKTEKAGPEPAKEEAEPAKVQSFASAPAEKLQIPSDVIEKLLGK